MAATVLPNKGGWVCFTQTALSKKSNTLAAEDGPFQRGLNMNLRKFTFNPAGHSEEEEYGEEEEREASSLRLEFSWEGKEYDLVVNRHGEIILHVDEDYGKEIEHLGMFGPPNPRGRTLVQIFSGED
jgi:hypothetical protein